MFMWRLLVTVIEIDGVKTYGVGCALHLHHQSLTSVTLYHSCEDEYLVNQLVPIRTVNRFSAGLLDGLFSVQRYNVVVLLHENKQSKYKKHTGNCFYSTIQSMLNHLKCVKLYSSGSLHCCDYRKCSFAC